MANEQTAVGPSKQPCEPIALPFADVVSSATTLLCSKGLLPFPVDLSVKLNDVAPWLQSRYRTFITTTRNSVPALRLGTRALAGRPLEFLPSHRGAGSHVPHKSLDRVHAAFVPDAD
jgi:hypothetical protein